MNEDELVAAISRFISRKRIPKEPRQRAGRWDMNF